MNTPDTAKVTVKLIKDCTISGNKYKAGDEVKVMARVAEILAQRKLINK